jgi:hypothetical protein
MFKQLSSKVSITLCGMLLTAALLSAEESGEKERVSVGTRAQSAEFIARGEARAEIAKQTVEQVAEQDSQETAPQKMIKSPAKSLYYALHPSTYQNPVAVSFYGDSVELMDGSVWSISPYDSYKTMNWYVTDLVVVSQNHSFLSAYDFILTNTTTGVSVAANMYLGPILPADLGYGIYAHTPYSIYTHWIVTIDYLYNRVYLEDGTVFYMSSFDSGIVAGWIPGDIVIVGLNNDALSAWNPNILINVATLECAAGAVGY